MLTPDLQACGVSGVTRQRIIHAASRWQLAVDVCHLSLTELCQADEVVICNSLFGAWQVTTLNLNATQQQHWPIQALSEHLRTYLLT